MVCFQDNYCVNVEIRDTDAEREIGLMFRSNLNENQGMLFIFDNPIIYSFWMKNMKVNIDMIFLDADRNIVYISQNAFPCTKPDNECELYTPDKNYQYVVETKAGFSQKHNLKIGQEVYFYLEN